MPQLALTGAWEEAAEALARLAQDGHVLRLSRDESLLRAACQDGKPELLLAVMSNEGSLPGIVATAADLNVPWIAVTTSDTPRLTAGAYEAGALAVLPGDAGSDALRQTVRTALAAATPPKLVPVPSGSRRFARGETIHVLEDTVIEVRAGVIAMTVIHPDGAEVLLGLAGPGQVLTGHPEDGCDLRLLAHTDVELIAGSWESAFRDPAFPLKLRARLRQMEAWASMQARPHLDQRILGIFSLLAEQFGHRHRDGLVVDVQITHAQIAAAVGSTRATVTRTLGDLRTRGVLASVSHDGSERYCLRAWESAIHTSLRA